MILIEIIRESIAFLKHENILVKQLLSLRYFGVGIKNSYPKLATYFIDF